MGRSCENSRFGPKCELEHEHAGPHRNGNLVWHDPPVLVVEEEDAVGE